MIEIQPSARKHGIADEDIGHIVTHATAVDDIDDDTRLCMDRPATSPFSRC